MSADIMSRRSELRRRLRATGGRGRKLRGLASLLAPYRWRVVAMVASVVVATAAALAPAPLAKLAIDNGIMRHDTTELDLIVIAFLVSAVLYAIATYLQTYLDLPRRLGRPARAPGPPRAAVPAPPGPVDRVLLA
jgi:hypothetical protein